MAYAIVHHFPGGTKEQYEASIRAVHPDDGRTLPDGQIFHAAGPSEDGWTITAVHESQESWERFRDNTLMPTMQAGIARWLRDTADRDLVPGREPAAGATAGLVRPPGTLR